MDMLDPRRIQDTLTTRVFGRELVYLARTRSTNDVAREMAAQGAAEGTVVLAEEQTAGRGRMGRRWSAPAGACLLCSILFRPTLPLARAQWLTMVCALAASDAAHEVAGLRVALKWPNDLIAKAKTTNFKSKGPKAKLQGWRKLGGVLTEAGVVGERATFVVVGMGINVNVKRDALPALAPDATSFLAETGHRVDRTALLAALLGGVEARYGRLGAGESPHAEWAARLATLGRRVRATTAGRALTGVAEAVDEDGALLLRTPDGALHRLLAGDVTLAQAKG